MTTAPSKARRDWSDRWERVFPVALLFMSAGLLVGAPPPVFRHLANLFACRTDMPAMSAEPVLTAVGQGLFAAGVVIGIVAAIGWEVASARAEVGRRDV